MYFIGIGVAFLLTWLLYVVFTITLSHALLVTAIVFIILGLFLEKPWVKL